MPRPEQKRPEPVEERRLTRAEEYAYWRERFTAKEIREVGGNLAFVSRDGRQRGYDPIL